MTWARMVGRHFRMPPPVARRGSVLMEFILVCPLLVILVSMLLQFSQIWIAREITAYASYCATRAVLSANSSESDVAAQKAAELACSWMCLAGLPGVAASGSSGGGSETVHLGRLHDINDIDDYETVDYDDGSPVGTEVRIPGWGTIPGSDSAKVRVKARVVSRGGESGLAMVKVEFMFPLVLPLAGRMISYFAKMGEDGGLGASELDPHDYGSHKLTGGNNAAWSGQEAVMDENGVVHDRTGATWGQDGRFPVVTLTDTCVISMRYSSENIYPGTYPGTADLPRGAGT